MKQRGIFMKVWTDLHDRNRVVDTDAWYLALANELVPVINGSALFADEDLRFRERVALMVALYLEDCVADAGHWRSFIRWHQQSYGRYLPFYTLSETYLPDEINREDLALIFWSISSLPLAYYKGVYNPLDAKLLALADEVYDYLDERFEEAPISNHLAEGWFIPPEQMEIERTPLRRPMPGETLPDDVKRFLEATPSSPLRFFNTYAELEHFLTGTLGWDKGDESLFPDWEDEYGFVLYANPKGILVGIGIAVCFAHPDNPYYNPKMAEDIGYQLFCAPGVCPFDLLKYGVEHQLLPDARLPFEGGRELLMDNWDFLARWFLGLYYEGD